MNDFLEMILEMIGILVVFVVIALITSVWFWVLMIFLFFGDPTLYELLIQYLSK